MGLAVRLGSVWLQSYPGHARIVLTGKYHLNTIPCIVISILAEHVFVKGIRFIMQKEPSFHHFHVQHYCPVAQTLDKLGDRWSFLIVRDLMRGPLRFTDLQRYLGGITPKRLTVLLRSMESEGIVEREREEGRREVWYRLTEKGRGLVPVIEALAVWGVENTTRPPSSSEIVYPERMMGMVSVYLNKRGLQLAQPVKWAVVLGSKSVASIVFDGQRWSPGPGDATGADVRVETTSETWSAYLYGPRTERHHLLEAMQISGEPARVEEFKAFDWLVK